MKKISIFLILLLISLVISCDKTEEKLILSGEIPKMESEYEVEYTLNVIYANRIYDEGFVESTSKINVDTWKEYLKESFNISFEQHNLYLLSDCVISSIAEHSIKASYKSFTNEGVYIIPFEEFGNMIPYFDDYFTLINKCDSDNNYEYEQFLMGENNYYALPYNINDITLMGRTFSLETMNSIDQDIPTTTGELFSVLSDIKNYSNEAPIYIYSNYMNGAYYEIQDILNSFGIINKGENTNNSSSRHYYNSRVSYNFNTIGYDKRTESIEDQMLFDNAIEAFKYIKTLYSSGLIDNDPDLNTNPLTNYSELYFNTEYKSKQGFLYYNEFCEPYYEYNSCDYAVVVSNEEKNPYMAVTTYLEALNNYQLQKTLRYGIKGEGYIEEIYNNQEILMINSEYSPIDSIVGYTGLLEYLPVPTLFQMKENEYELNVDRYNYNKESIANLASDYNVSSKHMLDYYLNNKINRDIKSAFYEIFNIDLYANNMNVEEAYKQYCDIMKKNGADELLDEANDKLGLFRKYYY